MDYNSILKFENYKLYILLSTILTILIGLYKPLLGILTGVIFIFIAYDINRRINFKNEEIIRYIENLSEHFESATKHAIFNMPFPLVMINEDGDILWYNTPFINMVDGDNILDKKLDFVIGNEKIKDTYDNEDKKTIEIEYNNNDYLVFSNYVENKRKTTGDNIILLYWINNSELIEYKKRYENDKSVVSLVYVDNYEDVRNNTPEVKSPMLLAEIDRRVRDYFTRYNGLVRKYENNKYFVIMDNRTLEKLKEDSFGLLDTMRNLDMGNKIPITLSMGISYNETNLEESYKNAKAAIDIALGRGGDQAVLNRNGKFDFYGGETQAVEKRNKVRARVIGYALKQSIDQADKVFIMGHKNADMDAFGSAIGVLRGVKRVGRDGYIVLNEINPSIKNIYNSMKEQQAELLDDIITTEEAKDLITKDSLMVLVDNHKPSFTEAPELLDLLDKVIVIDHHRRGAEFVEDPILTYLEPYASSASELVTEILSYMYDDVGLTKFEAEALLAGITVDTKNFSFQTGVRTFEAASLLKRAGADSTNVRQLFRDDYDTYVYRAEVIQSSTKLTDNIVIGRLDYDLDDSILIAAQSANELLDISGMEASFVLTHIDDKIHISGRSLGNISVQLILEELGGGGHLTSAGVQISDVSIEEAEDLLVKAIKKHI